MSENSHLIIASFLESRENWEEKRCFPASSDISGHLISFLLKNYWHNSQKVHAAARNIISPSFSFRSLLFASQAICMKHTWQVLAKANCFTSVPHPPTAVWKRNWNKDLALSTLVLSTLVLSCLLRLCHGRGLKALDWTSSPIWQTHMVIAVTLAPEDSRN